MSKEKLLIFKFEITSPESINEFYLKFLEEVDITYKNFRKTGNTFSSCSEKPIRKVYTFLNGYCLEHLIQFNKYRLFKNEKWHNTPGTLHHDNLTFLVK